MAVKPEDDFQGYMEAQARAAQDELEREAILERHRIWRETTWGGFAVRQIQALAEHFSPFFHAIANSMKNESSAGNIVVMIIIRLIIIIFAISMFYVGAWLVQTFIGNEIVIEEEEIIVVDGDEDDAEEEEQLDENKKKDQ